MSLRSFEAAILSELKVVSKNSRIRHKDIMEWQRGNSGQQGERLDGQSSITSLKEPPERLRRPTMGSEGTSLVER